MKYTEVLKWLSRFLGVKVSVRGPLPDMTRRIKIEANTPQGLRLLFDFKDGEYRVADLYLTEIDLATVAANYLTKANLTGKVRLSCGD